MPATSSCHATAKAHGRAGAAAPALYACGDTRRLMILFECMGRTTATQCTAELKKGMSMHDASRTEQPSRSSSTCGPARPGGCRQGDHCRAAGGDGGAAEGARTARARGRRARAAAPAARRPQTADRARRRGAPIREAARGVVRELLRGPAALAAACARGAAEGATARHDDALIDHTPPPPRSPTCPHARRPAGPRAVRKHQSLALQMHHEATPAMPPASRTAAKAGADLMAQARGSTPRHQRAHAAQRRRPRRRWVHGAATLAAAGGGPFARTRLTFTATSRTVRMIFEEEAPSRRYGGRRVPCASSSGARPCRPVASARGSSAASARG